MVLLTTTDKILFLIWLQSLCLNVTHLPLFAFYSLNHFTLLRGGVPRWHPCERVMCRPSAAWSRRIDSWGRPSVRCMPALNFPTEITMNELGSVTPYLINHSLLGTGTVRWRTQTHKHKRSRTWSLMHLLFLSVEMKISCRRSRGFSNSSSLHPSLQAPSSPAARLTAALLFLQHPPPPPPPAVDTWGETQYHPRVQMNLLLRDEAPALKTLWSLCPETKYLPLPHHWWD